MYEELNCFEEALKHFGTRVDVIIAMEMARRITPEESYQRIKDELKELKKCRKQFNKNGCEWFPKNNTEWRRFLHDGLGPTRPKMVLDEPVDTKGNPSYYGASNQGFPRWTMSIW